MTVNYFLLYNTVKANFRGTLYFKQRADAADIICEHQKHHAGYLLSFYIKKKEYCSIK